MDLLRMVTAGSVDDGKSTLIGRLLFDSKILLADQLQNLERASSKKGLNNLDFSLVTDGLKDELAQGITIDVAYKYFTTAKRKFILADTPGHFEYTRNFVTAVSRADLALILIDARKGVVEQTKRHAFIASMMGVKHLVFCINKMDLVAYSASIFQNIKTDIEQLSSKLEVQAISYIPIAALHGENIVHRSEHMDWYKGQSLLEILEHIQIVGDKNFIDARFPIQLELTHDKDHLCYAGQVTSGTFKTGDEVMILPSGKVSHIRKIYGTKGYTDEAGPSMSVTIALEDKIEAGRGSVIVQKNSLPKMSIELEVMVCWFAENELMQGDDIIVRTLTQEIEGNITGVLSVTDIEQYKQNEGRNKLEQNDIGRIKIKLNHRVVYDNYKHIKGMGSIILVDRITNNTMGAGLICQ